MIEHNLQYYERGFSLCNYLSVQLSYDFLSEQIRQLKIIHVDTPNSQQLIEDWSKWLIDSIALTGEKFDLIIRVPGHDEATIKKSKAIHNLALKVASGTGCLFHEDMLSKTHITQPQRNNDPEPDIERRSQNIQDSFQVNTALSELKNSKILVIDDVITTGATLKEVGKALHACNSKNKLYFFTLASAAREQLG